MSDEQVQQLVEQLSRDYFGLPFQHRAYFNGRLKSTGGRYLLKTHHIELNKKLYDHFGMEELRGIILHELCHYHLHIRGMGYQHRDRDFRELMKRVGAPRFCSSLPKVQATRKKVSQKVHTYRCVNCLLIYRRKRKMDERKYCCSKCGGAIRWQRTETIGVE
jgi:SprT-like protein